MKQLSELKRADQSNCYEKAGGFYKGFGNAQFRQSGYFKSTAFKIEQKLKVDKPGAVAFEIRAFPEPLKVGEWTKYIKIHVSRYPQHGVFRLTPRCKLEPALKFDIKGGDKYYELGPLAEGSEDAMFEPFYFEFRIQAPRGLKCFGNFPYKIGWKVQAEKVDKRNDEVRKPPAIFLMVIRDSWDTLDAHNTGTEDIEKGLEKRNAAIYEDGLSDPKCVEKYSERKKRRRGHHEERTPRTS